MAADWGQYRRPDSVCCLSRPPPSYVDRQNCVPCHLLFSLTGYDTDDRLWPAGTAWQRLTDGVQQEPDQGWRGAMVKMVAFVKRRAGLDRQVFLNYWRQEHLSLVKELPGLILARTNVGLVIREREPGYDLIAEAYWE